MPQARRPRAPLARAAPTQIRATHLRDVAPLRRGLVRGQRVPWRVHRPLGLHRARHAQRRRVDDARRPHLLADQRVRLGVAVGSARVEPPPEDVGGEGEDGEGRADAACRGAAAAALPPARAFCAGVVGGDGGVGRDSREGREGFG